jgi:hypothetical protein
LGKTRMVAFTYKKKMVTYRLKFSQGRRCIVVSYAGPKYESMDEEITILEME